MAADSNIPLVKKLRFLRNAESGLLAEIFLVNSIGSIIAVRVFLHLTKYPQLGVSGLHIAHMLWGGFLLLAALFLLIVFIDRFPRYIAAVIGGLGFGAFIDELGKLITADNNYFYKPTYALIYLIFICLFFIFRYISSSQSPTKAEYFGNALELLKEAAIGDFDKNEKRRYLDLLSKAELSKPVYEELKTLTKSVKSTHIAKPNFYVVIKEYLTNAYTSLLKKNWFSGLLITVFIVRVAFTSLTVGSVVLSESFFKWGFLLSAAIANLLLIWGIITLKINYQKSLHTFRHSILISILIYQFFAFYYHQLLALIGVGADIFVLYALNFMVEHSRKK